MHTLICNMLTWHTYSVYCKPICNYQEHHVMCFRVGSRQQAAGYAFRTQNVLWGDFHIYERLTTEETTQRPNDSQEGETYDMYVNGTGYVFAFMSFIILLFIYTMPTMACKHLGTKTFYFLYFTGSCLYCMCPYQWIIGFREQLYFHNQIEGNNVSLLLYCAETGSVLQPTYE